MDITTDYLLTCKTEPNMGRLTVSPGTGSGHWSMSWQAVRSKVIKDMYVPITE